MDTWRRRPNVLAMVRANGRCELMRAPLWLGFERSTGWGRGAPVVRNLEMNEAHTQQPVGRTARLRNLEGKDARVVCMHLRECVHAAQGVARPRRRRSRRLPRDVGPRKDEPQHLYTYMYIPVPGRRPRP